MRRRLREQLVRLRREEEGQGLVEYALLIACIALASTAGMGSVASAVNSTFNRLTGYIGNYAS